MRPSRPGHQRVLGVLVLGLLVQPIIAWFMQLSTLLGTCPTGVRNRGLSGELQGRHCVLYRGQVPVAKVPWDEDVWITGMLVLTLLCVLVALLLPRWSKWSHRLAITAVPALITAGLLMGGRGFRRIEGEVSEFLISSGSGAGGSFGRVEDGWMLQLPLRMLWIPDIGGLPLGLSFFSGLVLLVLVSALLADYYRHRPVEQAPERVPA